MKKNFCPFIFFYRSTHCAITRFPNASNLNLSDYKWTKNIFVHKNIDILSQKRLWRKRKNRWIWNFIQFFFEIQLDLWLKLFSSAFTKRHEKITLEMWLQIFISFLQLVNWIMKICIVGTSFRQNLINNISAWFVNREKMRSLIYWRQTSSNLLLKREKL